MSSRQEQIVTPVLRVTLYDRVSSWAMALFLGILVACSLVVVMWVSTRKTEHTVSVPMELVELPGGFLDGTPGETLRVDSPEPESRDASPADTMEDRVEIAEAVESVVQMAETATQSVQQQFETGIQNSGKGGSAKGTGRRALGFGPGTGGFPREQRWFVRFSDRIPLSEYSRQLEFFGIELGALLPDGRLAYLSNPSADVPTIRYVKSGADENRLYMTWQGGDRRTADVQLFGKAKVDIRSDTIIFHFYSKKMENELAQLEIAYRNRKASQIRRTYYAVEPDGPRYKFSVYKQIPYQ